jgi:hypothetical protein
MKKVLSVFVALMAMQLVSGQVSARLMRYAEVSVWDDPNILMQDRDPQMELVVEEVMNLLEGWPPKMTPAQEPENRTAGDLKNIY